jgi:hypothetical protein
MHTIRYFHYRLDMEGLLAVGQVPSDCIPGSSYNNQYALHHKGIYRYPFGKKI